ncbi:hypothetical protein SAMN03159338_3045 [Sphingomonas sp. NFR04]|uniref:hypothetical protein n=1 Tax=Sphingomonas sp. NFR04 TaxID=1566283 RepID=UPI0008EA3F2F|nr:hypothetical protein [Sphingomonas sp. NFR04]SFK02934.1 hypothetical protein SAMN03159338_3045 [Sphingomonas sp. NFR04]
MLLLALTAVATPLPPSAVTFITGTLHLERYRATAADLNEDGAAEVLVYAEGPEHCGSGGCNLYVLSRAPTGWRIVTKMGVTRLPLRILPAKSHGWHDVSVHVAGGGILPGHDVRLRFDGHHYPENPTMSPAERLPSPSGRILLR